ncbi:MAG: hypothetical protein E6Q98_24730 [Rhodospirillaceae bacterium]|nr:MAG: hypothetical protein E6Q98_24730 [Rhodospirillaceae bacterium]
MMIHFHKAFDDSDLGAYVDNTLQACREAGCVEDEIVLALLESLGHLVLQTQERVSHAALRLTNDLRRGLAAHMVAKMRLHPDFKPAALMIEVDQDLIMEACAALRDLIANMLASEAEEMPDLLGEKLLDSILRIDPDWLDTPTAMALIAAARAADEDWLDNGGEVTEMFVSVN